MHVYLYVCVCVCATEAGELDGAMRAEVVKARVLGQFSFKAQTSPGELFKWIEKVVPKFSEICLSC